jgi:hypothetical protein
LTSLLTIATKGVHASASKTDKNLVILGWDGVGRTPTLERLLARGSLPWLSHFITTKDTRLYPLEIHDRTVTIPSWAKVFTGLDHDQTGTFGNTNISKMVIDEEHLKKYHGELEGYGGVDFWCNQLPWTISLLSSLQAIGYRTGWFVSKEYLGRDTDISPYCEIRDNTDADLFPTIGGDNYLDKVQGKLLSYIKKPDKFVVFAHFNPDYYGHIYSETGLRYEEEIIRCDTMLGGVLKTIDRSETAIMVLSDHGFDPGLKTHYNAPDAFLVTDLPISSSYLRGGANNRDLTPTILDWYGVAWGEVDGIRRRGKSLLRV